jgi:hypothetical protein
MRYFFYNPGETNITLIGADKNQIAETLRHYNLPVPPEEEMRELPRVRVMCAIGSPSTKHSFNARVADRVSFEVHATAFEHIKEIARDFEGLKRGSLYKFDTGRRDYGLLFLPETIMRSLQTYNWDRHRKQVEEWIESGEETQPYADKTGKFVARPNETLPSKKTV